VVVDTYAQGTSKDAAAMAYLAWVPALAQPTPRLVGEAVTAVGIAKGDAGVDVPVTLKLSPTGGGDPLVLSSTSHYGCGVVSLPLPLPVWGKWTLAADGESPQEIGSLGVEGKKPEIRYDGAGGIDSPVKVPKTEGLFTWTVDFKQNCPVRMSGCVMLQSWKDSEEQPSPDDTMPEDFAVPIEIVASASPEGVQIKDGFVVNADPKLHLTSSFTYGDYSSGGAPISCGLIQTVQAIRDAYKKATGRGVTLTGLTPDGLTVTLKGNPDKLAKAATGSKAHVVQAPNGITITMQPPDGTASGRITFQFDPSAAIGALLRAKGLAPGEQLNVRFGLLFPNGGFFADESLQVRSLTYSGAELNAGLFEKVNFAKLRADPSNCIEAWPRPFSHDRAPGVWPSRALAGG